MPTVARHPPAPIAFLLRKGNTVEMLHEQHTFGLFAQANWLRFLVEAGFQPAVHTIRGGELVFLGNAGR